MGLKGGAMGIERHIALYFVASPLQYLAARQIAERFEAGARQILVWYKRGVAPIVRKEHWDASAYMAWPRWEPLPGPFGRHLRLRANVRDIAALVGPCDTLHIHSAVFDTEAINYFLRALPKACGARKMLARILPDGIISVRRYPLSPLKAAAQYLRKLRRFAAPELDYWCFTGDRIGSDAPFCDRIYVLPGLPHEYPARKVVVLPPLVDAPRSNDEAIPRRALVIGQPLVGAGLMKAADRDAVSREIRDWLFGQGITEIHYKGHPKDPHRELCEPEYRILDIDEPLEIFMSHSSYAVVAGVRSSALIFARQLRPTSTRVLSFGLNALCFKSEAEKDAITKAFIACRIEIRHA
jgi:hypothetical protein